MAEISTDPIIYLQKFVAKHSIIKIVYNQAVIP